MVSTDSQDSSEVEMALAEGTIPLIGNVSPQPSNCPGAFQVCIRGYNGINDANSVVLVQSSPRQPVEGHTRDTEQFPC